MGNVMAYSGLTTKIRAMQAKLLTQADYETISGFTEKSGDKPLQDQCHTLSPAFSAVQKYLLW